ncbi:MAG TPA: cytochrome c maturation protein CcmE [Acidimicrobiales bacterium]|nr:cytochrome c maturation protein CcmE [Acidimicrobiales bacterium]
MELTPRTLDDDDVTLEEGDVRPRPPRRRPRRRWAPLAVLAAVLVGIGAFVYRGLDDAALYFRNADEAVAQRDELGTRRFRLQGTVAGDPVAEDGHVAFDVTFDGVTVPVDHAGTPPDMFAPGIPVVLEGRWRADGTVFESDRMLVKHDESYESEDDYRQRMGEAERGGDATTRGRQADPATAGGDAAGGR